MKTKQTLAIAGAIGTIGLAGLTGLGIASAHAGNPQQGSLISKIAEKFGLNTDDVQAVFDENKAELEAEHQSQVSEHLQSAVDDGTITTEQKTLIEQKLQELKDSREAHRTELQTWADDNGIDLKYLRPSGSHSEDGANLQSAVADGSITAEQKTLIEQKQTELKDRRQSARDELQQWAADNDVPLRFLVGAGGFGHHGHGPGGPF